MGADKRTGKEIPAGQELSGKASDQLRDYVEKTGDNSTWQGKDGENERNGSGFWRPKL